MVDWPRNVTKIYHVVPMGKCVLGHKWSCEAQLWVQGYGETRVGHEVGQFGRKQFKLGVEDLALSCQG